MSAVRPLFALVFFFVAGCSCAIPCDFPVTCVDHCGGTVVRSGQCGACPTGSVPIGTCVTDAAPTPDGGTDAARLPDAPDAFVSDVGHDAAMCARPGYPTQSTATRTERTAVESAAAAFMTSTGVTVTLDDTTAAVAGFSAPFPITYDTTIADPCMRAEAAIRAFFADHTDLMRIPADMIVRACSYDDLTDAEVVRIHGGTYQGRRLIGQDNDLVVHVSRSGNLRYWGGSYLPVVQRLIPEACYDGHALEGRVVGDPLGYMQFHACVPGSPGTYDIQSSDTRTAGDPALFVDADGLVHIARQIEVLLDPAHVGPDEESSTLYCCGTPSLVGCVGAFLIVDEVTGEVLSELPRCITC